MMPPGRPTARVVPPLADRADLWGAALAAPALRFLVVGGLNTALGFVLFHALLRAFGGRPNAAGLAQALAYAAGIAISYAANRGWTFRTAGAHGRAVPRFVAAQLTSLALSTALVQFGVAVLGLAPTVCWVLVTGLTTVLNFMSQRYWIFPRP